MKNSQLELRLSVMESLMSTFIADHQQKELRLFFARLTDQELDIYASIAERTDDGQLPLTDEEQSFLDDLEAKYGPIGETEV